MLPNRRPTVRAGLAASLLVVLTACANSSTGNVFKDSLAADSKLRESTGNVGQPGGDGQTATNASRPADFPAEIPIYPESQLQDIVPVASPTPVSPTPTGAATNATANPTEKTTGQAQWTSGDPSNFVQSFYLQQLQTNGWQLVSQATQDLPATLVARRNDLQITVAIGATATFALPTPSDRPDTASPDTASPAPSSTPIPSSSSTSTVFTIDYAYESGSVSSQAVNPNSEAPQPGDSEFVGPVLEGATASGTTSPATSTPVTANPQGFTDLDKAPKELRSYLKDLAQLGVLPLRSSDTKSAAANRSTLFEPNKIITRREYARWLVTANNRIYSDRSGQQVRLGSSGTKPVFQDVPKTNPDFEVIQGLAEAGIIPSPLSGEATVVNFRPDAPLTREVMLLWKLPLDTRQALPAASLDAVKETWGFQDAGKIDPKALRAVLADFQNGDLANIRRALGYTTLFQPKKSVTRAEAAATLWYFGSQGEGLSALELLQSPSGVTASPRPAGP
ncbi:S-layer homology domain-containing protein [Trichocoleus sp. FACHB-591]|uniref:S-layer homology domain-containing protein n=1 Tax=Trichocoleus sp. FACHB-591 TaxID=2692872 RepID=UPI001682116E|nr:S-layer homology domain-containing protein [Trichocoleus sp. FACHB-591]